MIHKILRPLAFAFLVAATTALTIGYIAGGGKGLGKYPTRAVHSLLKLPQVIDKLFTELPPYLKEANFEVINHLESDLYALHSYQETHQAALINLKTNDIIHQWDLGGKASNPNIRYRVMLLPDMEILCYTNAEGYFARLDSSSQVVWESEGEFVFHHGMYLDSSGGVWTCTRDSKYVNHPFHSTLDTFYFAKHLAYPFTNESVTRFDLETGEVTHTYSLFDIYNHNGLNPILTSYSSRWEGDIFHLNCVRPVTTEMGVFKKGDLLISMRHQNSVIQFDPGSEEIKAVWDSGFFGQHDVRLVGDSAISVFNNNVPVDLKFAHVRVPEDPVERIYSESILIDSMGTVVRDEKVNEVLKEHNIFTQTEGMLQYLPSGRIFIEQQNAFNIWVFDGDELRYKSYYNVFTEEGLKEIPNWTKVYEELP